MSRIDQIKEDLEIFQSTTEENIKYLMSNLEIATDALKEAKDALDKQYFCNGGIIENNVAYMAIFNGLQMIHK